MTVFFLISASFLFGCGNKDSAVPETEEFLFSAEEEKSDHTSQKSEEPAEKAERKKAEADSGTVEENPERKKYSYMFAEKFRLRAYMNWNRIPECLKRLRKRAG
ncbi:hypothetical protein M5E84_06170 [[Ruminococcus] torques]|nr:hypothetical protein M5E84_06170 [[Ruminococcus] torques]